MCFSSCIWIFNILVRINVRIVYFLKFKNEILILSIRVWPILFLYTVINLFYLYLSQFDYGGYSIADSWLSGTDSAGIWFNGNYEPLEIAPVFTEAVVLILIILIVCLYNSIFL